MVKEALAAQGKNVKIAAAELKIPYYTLYYTASPERRMRLPRSDRMQKLSLVCGWEPGRMEGMLTGELDLDGNPVQQVPEPPVAAPESRRETLKERVARSEKSATLLRSDIAALRGQMTRIEAKLDHVLKELGVSVPAPRSGKKAV
jgi:hypothetical protein